MPNSNTYPGVTQGSAPEPPPAFDAAHPFDRLRTYQDALDYSLAAQRTALRQARASTGVVAQLWTEAAQAFGDAHDAMLPLVRLPEADAFARARDLLHAPNHVADEATGAAATS